MFELTPSFENLDLWEDSIGKPEADGKLKFPVTFHDKIEKINEVPDLLSLEPPKKKEKTVKVVELGKKNKNKKGLF